MLLAAELHVVDVDVVLLMGVVAADGDDQLVLRRSVHGERVLDAPPDLKWNGQTEQLTSGRSDMVKIEKDDTIMRGSGFTASGISKTFSFRGNITGTIETDGESEESAE